MKNNSNIYLQRQRWKLILFILAIIIGIASIIYTNRLVKQLSVEEKKKIELWAEGTRTLIEIDPSNTENINFIFKVIENNTTVPVIWVDENDSIISYRNLDSLKVKNKNYLLRQLNLMKAKNEPIEMGLINGQKNYIYYKDSILLTKLLYYPYIQMGVIVLFIFIAYLAFNATRKAEQNQVWVGMSKETAHQLGTPISSLIAWVELLKGKINDKALINELENDVSRLEKITERFSKIGSAPILKMENIIEVIKKSVEYIKTRSSNAIEFKYNFDEKAEIIVPINASLFEWVIENICKNAVDAMKSEGKIEISVYDNIQVIYIDIKDTGKGISKSKYKTIFRPGYTTKPRGWGLGLSLTKRIVETYHDGKIFVNESEINGGTTIRIVLRK